MSDTMRDGEQQAIPHARWLGLSDRLYGVLLTAYPADFRQAFGGEMRALFRACCRDAAREGRVALLAVWLSAMGDLTKNALLERLSGAPQNEKAGKRMTLAVNNRTLLAWQGGVGNNAFGKRLADVLSHNPTYSDLLVPDEPPRQVLDVVDSMALDADPARPDAAVTLFEQLCQDLPPEESDALVRQLRESMWRAGAEEAVERAAESGDTLTGELLRRVYADPALFGLVASVGADADLADLLDVLALDARADDVEEALGLVRQLSMG
jgi:hypothetical protein